MSSQVGKVVASKYFQLVIEHINGVKRNHITTTDFRRLNSIIYSETLPAGRPTLKARFEVVGQSISPVVLDAFPLSEARADEIVRRWAL